MNESNETYTCHTGEARSDLRAWPSSILGRNILMQLTECRTRKFSPNLDRPLVWAGGIEMELPMLRTHVLPIFAHSSHSNFSFPPFPHLSSTERYSTSDIDAHISDEHRDHAYFANALPRESRHLRNVFVQSQTYNSSPHRLNASRFQEAFESKGFWIFTGHARMYQCKP